MFTGLGAEAGFTQVLRLRPCMPQLDRGRQEGSSAAWGGGYRAPKESVSERGYEVTWRAAGLGDGVPSAQFDSAHTRATGSSWRYHTRVVPCPRALVHVRLCRMYVFTFFQEDIRFNPSLSPSHSSLSLSFLPLWCVSGSNGCRATLPMCHHTTPNPGGVTGRSGRRPRRRLPRRRRDLLRPSAP
jgi:hypothetical protein